MLPWFQLTHVGPFNTVGFFAALGAAAFMAVVTHRLDRESWKPVLAACVGGVVGGAAGLAAWGPLTGQAFGTTSQVAVILGGFPGVLLATRLSGVRGDDLWRLFDRIGIALGVGIVLSKTGCVLVHCHPGVPFDGFGAVAFPDGPRLDMGLLDQVHALVLLVGLGAIRHRLRPGLLALLGGAGLGLGRVALDFFRIGRESAALGLSTIQWGFLIVGVACVAALPLAVSSPHLEPLRETS